MYDTGMYTCMHIGMTHVCTKLRQMYVHMYDIGMTYVSHRYVHIYDTGMTQLCHIYDTGMYTVKTNVCTRV